MAFVAGSTFVGSGKLSTHKSALCNRAVAASPKRRGAVRMTYQQGDKTIVTRNDLELEEQRKGFTFYSEKWNGRLAMLGFVIALATEVINPAHPTIVQQVASLFGQ